MTITNDNLLEMIEHWLNTPENGYFGSSYGGANIAASAINGLVDESSNKEFMDKLRVDIPALENQHLIISKSGTNISFLLGTKSKFFELTN